MYGKARQKRGRRHGPSHSGWHSRLSPAPPGYSVVFRSLRAGGVQCLLRTAPAGLPGQRVRHFPFVDWHRHYRHAGLLCTGTISPCSARRCLEPAPAYRRDDVSFSSRPFGSWPDPRDPRIIHGLGCRRDAGSRDAGARVVRFHSGCPS